MRIALRGPFNAYSGYGNDLIGLARVLTEAGHDVVPVATSIMSGLPPEVAMLFTKQPVGRFDVGILHQPPFDLKPSKSMRAQCDVLIGWTMWEQSKFTSEHQKGHKQGRRPWRDLDMILCYDPVTLEALDGYDPTVEKRILQGGIDVDRWPYVRKDWSGTFRFVMLGELHNRKDPMLAIEAFRELREEGFLEDAELHLKTSIPGLHPVIEKLIPGVYVYCEMWPPDKVREFLGQAHVILAPSRGEGKNLPALEVQLSGGMAIATGWGGHQVWQHPSYSPILDYKLVPIDKTTDSCQASASKTHLKELMRKAYENREEARRMGELASRTIRAMCSWETIAKKAEQFIGEAYEIARKKRTS